MNNSLPDETIRILRDMDVDAAIAQAPAHVMAVMTSRENCLAGLHKARVQAGQYFTLQELQEPREWLTDKGFKVPQ
jgi:hypothetical protein